MTFTLTDAELRSVLGGSEDIVEWALARVAYHEDRANTDIEELLHRG